MVSLSRSLLRQYYKAGRESVENPKIIFTDSPEIKEHKGTLYPTNPAFIAFFSGKRSKLDELKKLKYDDYELVE